MNFYSFWLREAAKKGYIFNGRAIKGWGGVKALSLFKLFFFIFYYVAIFKNINYLTFKKYGHITLKFVGRYIYWVVTFFFSKK